MYYIYFFACLRCVYYFFKETILQNDLIFIVIFHHKFVATQKATGSLYDKSWPFFRIHEKGLANTKDIEGRT